MTNDELVSAIKNLSAESTPPVVVPPYEVPELAPSQIPIEDCDRVKVLADGSSWDKWPDPTWMPDAPGLQKIQIIYGYLSKEKVGQVMWDKLCQRTTGGEARLQEIIDSNGKMARYRMSPSVPAGLSVGDGAHVLSMMLAAPILPAA